MPIYKKPAFRRGLVLCLVLGGLFYATFALLRPTHQTATIRVGEQLPSDILAFNARDMTLDTLDGSSAQLSSAATGSESIPVKVGEGFSFTGKQDRIRITTTKRTASAVTITYIRIPRVSP